jgi:sec-independent protein translocase protein TatA
MKTFLFIGTQKIIIIALLFLLIYEEKKIPELMKGLGKGVKMFKEGINGIEDEVKDNSKESAK